MSRRVGGRRRRLRVSLSLPVSLASAAPEDALGGAEFREVDRGEVDEDGLGSLLRSIHGFSGGRRGIVYCATASRERSHFLGAQTPTRTRQVATRRLACS
jgi:hypothetical protein